MTSLSILNGIKVVDMFPLEVIGTIKWNSDYASKLRALRAKTPRRVIIEKLAEDGIKILPETMRVLEDGSVGTVTIEVLVGLCNAYGVHFSAIIPCVKIGIPSNY